MVAVACRQYQAFMLALSLLFAFPAHLKLNTYVRGKKKINYEVCFYLLYVLWWYLRTSGRSDFYTNHFVLPHKILTERSKDGK